MPLIRIFAAGDGVLVVNTPLSFVRPTTRMRSTELISETVTSEMGTLVSESTIFTLYSNSLFCACKSKEESKNMNTNRYLVFLVIITIIALLLYLQM